MNVVWKGFYSIIFLLLIASFPLLIAVENGAITFMPGQALETIQTSFLPEKFMKYELGSEIRSIPHDVVSFGMNTGILLTYSVLLAFIISFLFGYLLNRTSFSKWIRRGAAVLSVVPDFVFVFFAILFAIQLYRATGIRLISLSPTRPTLSIWVPVFTLAITPTIYLIRIIALKYEELLTEDYVRTALAKGLSKRYIDLHHLYRNLKPFLLADLKKVISLTIGSLFVVEFLFNITGLTKFIFVDYQFQKTAVGLLVISLLGLAVYILLRAILYLFEKVMIDG
ncbi:MAG TPA: ABC transporter permease subunit [Bacillus sp. (in: firmicutes)]|nr:ABC transporter permease subunit [Bacillus sp. (in: firmicutes)]